MKLQKLKRSIETMPRPAYIFLKYLLRVAAAMLCASCLLFLTAGKDPARWLRPVSGCDLRLERLVEAALQEQDPLQKERALDRARWITADDLAGPDPLARERLFAYAIQLGILMRWQNRDAETGRQTFLKLTETPITL